MSCCNYFTGMPLFAALGWEGDIKKPNNLQRRESEKKILPWSNSLQWYHICQALMKRQALQACKQNNKFSFRWLGIQQLSLGSVRNFWWISSWLGWLWSLGFHCPRQGTNLTALFAHITGGCDAAYNPYQGSEVSAWTLLVYCRIKHHFARLELCRAFLKSILGLA